MNTPKISIPQALPAIFDEAKAESNWLIFAVGEADEKGKRPKRPVARDNPAVWVDRKKAATFTYDEAVKRLEVFRDWTGGLERINKKAEERRQIKLAGGKKPGPEIKVQEYVLGYFAREDSALVALDFDNVGACLPGGGDIILDDWELAGMLDETPAYAEFSSSGTGVRVFMPREWADESFHAGEKNDVGLFVSSKGAACALTFNTIADGVGRDQALFDLVLTRHGSVREAEEEADAGEVADQVLEHGIVPVETFLEMISVVENDDRFNEFNEWLAMIRGPKEYYEIVSPDRLDEVHAAVEEWCEGWTGGEHDAEKFDEVWERKARSGSKAGLGSWVHHAQEAGWDWAASELVDEEEIDEWAFLKKLQTEQIGTGKSKITRAIANYINAVRVVRHMPKLAGLIGRNVLTGGLVRLREWSGEGLEYPVEWTDIDMHRLLQTVQGLQKDGENIFSHFHIEQLKQAIEGAAKPVQPIKGMIESLPKWDGVPRIDMWLIDYFGVADTELARTYSRKFLIGLIARGCALPGKLVKCDTVLVLTGEQGMNKSTFFETLAGHNDLFADHVGDISKKEGAENIAGRWICEFAEGEVVTKADRRALKGFLARTSDKYRPAYGRNVQTFPRAGVFVMPTNDDAVLNDPTGSRRYWPVTATRVAPLGRVRVERRQLLAEARVAFEAGETWWLSAEMDAAREAEAVDYEVEDSMSEPLATILENVIEGQIVSQSDLLSQMGFELSKSFNGQAERRLRDLLKKWGWERAKSGSRRGYRRDSSKVSHPPMSDEALKAMTDGEVLPLPVLSEFSKIE